MEDLTFEEAMKKLEEITNELEDENIDLDTSVKKFEEGMKLSQKCNKILEDAEKKITILVDGNFLILFFLSVDDRVYKTI